MRFWAQVCYLYLLLIGIGFAVSDAKEITISCGAVGKELELCQSGALAWSKKTGNSVKVVSAAQNSNDRLGHDQLLLASKSSDIDVFIIDTPWPGIIGDFFLNLDEYVPPEVSQQYFKSFILNNRVRGRLTALPWFIDSGLFFYRKDLLEKHGHSVPRTWSEMEKTAFQIQEAERKAGNADFWGFVFQGKAYEGLTCNALEWFVNSNAGTFVDDSGKVTVNQPNAVKILKQVSSWIGKISPRGVLNYMEEESRGVFQVGNALFMRNWPYAYQLASSPDSPVKGKIGITAIPHLNPKQESHGTLGGWSLAVSKFTRNPQESVSLVLYLTGLEEQKRRAVLGGFSPTLPSLYQDSNLLQTFPLLKSLYHFFELTIPRPSRVMGTRYNQASAEIWDSIHKILSGESDAESQLKSLEKNLNRISRNGKW